MALLSVWGILLVVLGHSGMAEPEIGQHVVFLKTWIYSFHMPLFFFISGYLFSLTNPDFLKIKTGHFLFKKVKRLLVPYFTLGLLSLFINLKGVIGMHPVDTLRSFAYPRELGFLWYIGTLFIIFVVVTLLSAAGVNLKKQWVAACSVLALLVAQAFMPNISLLNLSEACWYGIFFILGIYTQTNKNIIQYIVNKHYLGGVIFLMASICLNFLTLKSLSPATFSSLVAFASACAGILFSITFCAGMLRNERLSTKLLSIAAYTYSIYLLSKFGQIPARVLSLHLLHLHWLLCIVLMFFCGLLAPIVVCKAFEKISFLQKASWLRLVIGF